MTDTFCPLDALSDEFVLKKKNPEEQAFFNMVWALAYPDRMTAREFLGKRENDAK